MKVINQKPIRCVIMRGGTSKGIFFHERDLPADAAPRDAAILALMGSPDPRQVNGLGGADPLTSKIAIIGSAKRHDVDVTYTFGQVGIDQSYVSYSANCGNLSAAVGVYAIEEGMIEAVDPVTTVRIYNTNTRQILIAHVPVIRGAPAVEGNYAISGVPGSGAEIRLDFSQTSGATTGSMLPSGNLQDDLYVPELGKTIRVSFVDVAKATVYFRAADLDIRGTEGPEAFTADVLQRFWAVRNAGAKRIGLAPESRLPTPVSVLEPASYVNYMTRQPVTQEMVSFVARRVIGPPPRLHKAFAATGAVCTAVAATLPGTVVHEIARDFGDDIVQIGHPTGVFPVRIARDERGNLIEASYSRTARRIMEGMAYLPESSLA
jgi:hypothetical protein